MIVDLHTHSRCSDGSLTPRELLERAKARDVSLMSITDHDTIAAYEEVKAADYPEMTLVPGTELSCTWSGVNIHMLGLGLDLNNQQLVEQLQQQSHARAERADIIARRLEKLGFTGIYEGVKEMAAGRAIGRPDFARQMVKLGYVPSMNVAFDKYLGAGKPGDVKAVWPDLADAVAWIVAAGGVAVIAHPSHYKMTNAKLRRLLVDFKACGGEGIEVCNGKPPAVELNYLKSLCVEYGFEASMGSDFHSPSTWLDVGCRSELLGDCPVVWSRWC